MQFERPSVARAPERTRGPGRPRRVLGIGRALLPSALAALGGLIGSSGAARAQSQAAGWGPEVYDSGWFGDLVEVAANEYHSVGLQSDGSVVAWGSDEYYGKCRVPALPVGLIYTDVAAGAEHSAACRSDGSAVAWGENFEGQCNVPALPSGLSYVELEAGAAHTVALRNDGSVVAWGACDDGECDVPAPPSGLVYVEVSAGGNQTMARYGPSPLTVYCTAKTNSLNCLPSISASGGPSATAGSGLQVRAANIRNNFGRDSFLGFLKLRSAPGSHTTRGPREGRAPKEPRRQHEAEDRSETCTGDRHVARGNAAGGAGGPRRWRWRWWRRDLLRDHRRRIGMVSGIRELHRHAHGRDGNPHDRLHRLRDHGHLHDPVHPTERLANGLRFLLRDADDLLWEHQELPSSLPRRQPRRHAVPGMRRLLAALFGVLFLAPGCTPGAAAGASSSREELMATRDEVRIQAEAIRDILVDELIERGIYEDQLFADLSQWSGDVDMGHNAAVGVRYYPEEGGATRVRIVSIPVGYDAGFDDLRAELGRLESSLHEHEN